MSELRRNKEETSAQTPEQRLKRVSLAARQIELVQKLPGFKKSRHRVPEEITDRTQTFVGGLGGSRVRADLDHVFDALRNEFRFKRTQLDVHETDDGAGSITTPFFRYTSCVYQNPSNAGEIVWQRDISDVTAPETLLSRDFSAVFGQVFDTVEFVPRSPIDLEKLIDAIEVIDSTLR